MRLYRCLKQYYCCLTSVIIGKTYIQRRKDRLQRPLAILLHPIASRFINHIPQHTLEALNSFWKKSCKFLKTNFDILKTWRNFRNHQVLKTPWPQSVWGSYDLLKVWCGRYWINICYSKRIDKMRLYRSLKGYYCCLTSVIIGKTYIQRRKDRLQRPLAILLHPIASRFINRIPQHTLEVLTSFWKFL
jgi:hypothetical protein